jgi:crossover junction endodeoxyribonuclease RuvC
MGSETKILGIDPGMGTMGFGCLLVPENSEKTLPLEYGVISTPSGLSIPERLQILYNDLTTLIDHLQPHQVGIEKLFFYKMGNTILVAQARGVILLVLAQHQLIPQEFTPAQIKQSLTGYGNAEKREVQEAVARELGLSQLPKPNDAADALAIALTVWHSRI